MREMNIYRRTLQIATILLLVVFVFAATQSGRACSSYKTIHATTQSYLEHPVINHSVDWNGAVFSVNSPLIGTTWSNFSKDFVWKSVQRSESFSIGICAFSYFLLTPNLKVP